MSCPSKRASKRGLLALAATGVAIGVGIGAKSVVKYLKGKRELQREKDRLEALENEQFEEDYE